MSTQFEIKDLKPEVVALSETLKKEITLGKDGVGVVPADLYIRTLPAELSEKQIKLQQKHDTTFVAAATLAFGEVATDLFKKDSKIVKASVEIPTVGRDKITIGYDRVQSRPSLQDKTVTLTTYGRTSVKLDSFADRGGNGDLNKVRKIINDRAQAAFGVTEGKKK